MLLEVRAVPPFYKNGFVLGCEASREAVLIDPGHEVEELLEVVRRGKLSVMHILLTHAHVDHVAGVGRAKTVVGAPVHLHRGDERLYGTAVEQGALFGFRIDPPPPIDLFYEGGDRLTFGEYQVRIHHTPGHTPGSISLWLPSERKLIAGDTLFRDSIGRTDLPGGDGRRILASIRDKLFPLPDDALVVPGHGPCTTMGREKEFNAFLQRL